MKFRLALVVAALSGFIALSYEILWYRVLSFTTGAAASAFGLLLGIYLLGIALGSFRSRLYCEGQESTDSAKQLRVLATVLYLANLVSFFVAPAFAWAASALARPPLALLLVGLATALLGAVLPLVAHFAIAPDDRAGANLSYLYLANILGSASGSLVIGFVAMDRWSTETIAIALGVAGVALAGSLLPLAGVRGGRLALPAMGFVMTAAGMILLGPRLFDQLYERLLLKKEFTPDTHFAESVENRSGVINVTQDGRVWGGGAYDGALNTSIVTNSNWIVRAYGVAAMHAAPREMLMIGLASGSWAEVLAYAPGVEKLTIVEINPGYLEIIARHPEVAGVLHNPKVDIVIDDGRRWLLAHPERKFDFIVMNTTWHWRAHMTNLLSAEFLNLARAHMLPGGILFYNTTSSHDVYKTAVTVFPYALRVINFVAVSDSPFAFDKERWKKVLLEYRIEDKPVLDLSREEDKKTYGELLALADTQDAPPVQYGLEKRDSLAARTADGTIITDDNMATEWRELFPSE